MRNAGRFIALVGLAFLISASVASAADQPEAGRATLSNAQPLPQWGVLPQLVEGGFSGLFPVAGQPGQFWTVSDRGPNGDTFGTPVRRPFYSPAFTPSIYKVSVDTTTQQMTIIDRIPLKLPVGSVDPARATVGGNPTHITGFGNTAAQPGAPNVPVSDEIPTTDTNNDGVIDTNDSALPFDPYGLDTEGVAVDSRDGTFWLVEEYRPSIIHVAADGTILQRYTPAGQNAANLGPSWAAVPLKDILPGIYSTRRDNRGFEGVAISPNGLTLYAIVQNPLATICTGGSYVANSSRSATRIAKVDITDPANPLLIGDFFYTLDVNGSGVPVNANSRISDLFWMGPDQLLVDERDDSEGTAPQGGTSTTFKRIYKVDISAATNIQSLSAANQDCIDALKPADVAARGAVTGVKTLMLDLASTAASAEYPKSKLEGLVRRDNGNLATINDNDFQVAGPNATLYIEYGTGAPAPVVPEAPLIVLMPLAALALGGASWLIVRRRPRVA